MALVVPILNPIRFYDPTSMPNYSTRWPNMDNGDVQTEWQKGIYPSLFYHQHLLNQALVIQLRYDSAITEPTITVYKFNNNTGNFDEYDFLSPTDVSPAGWIDLPVYNYSFTPTEIGVYYFDFDDADIISDKFRVFNTNKYLKRLVEIEFYHYENKYTMVFWDGETQKFTGKVYLQGQLIDGELSNEISEYTDDPGEVELLDATPQRTAILNIFHLHYKYTDFINYLFSCSNITINGIQYQNKEAPKKEKVPKSDLVNFSVELFQKNNDHSLNI